MKKYILEGSTISQPTEVGITVSKVAKKNPVKPKPLKQQPFKKTLKLSVNNQRDFEQKLQLLDDLDRLEAWLAFSNDQSITLTIKKK